MVANKTQRKLTAPQEAFCLLVAQGMAHHKAYSQAYPKCTPAACRSNASRLLTNGNIENRIKELRKPSLKKHQLTIDRKHSKLREIVDAGENRDALKAIDIHNRMAGDYEPEKREHIFKVVIGGNADD